VAGTCMDPPPTSFAKPVMGTRADPGADGTLEEPTPTTAVAWMRGIRAFWHGDKQVFLCRVGVGKAIIRTMSRVLSIGGGDPFRQGTAVAQGMVTDAVCIIAGAACAVTDEPIAGCHAQSGVATEGVVAPLVGVPSECIVQQTCLGVQRDTGVPTCLE